MVRQRGFLLRFVGYACGLQGEPLLPPVGHLGYDRTASQAGRRHTIRLESIDFTMSKRSRQDSNLRPVASEATALSS